MKDFLKDLKYKAVCRRKRNQMIKTYLNGVYFQFDSDNHVQYCLKCQTAGKRYRAFREELENEVQVEVEAPEDFTSRVMSSLDKKVKTTTSKSTKIILLTLLGILSVIFLIFGRKRSSSKLEKEQ